MRAAWWIQLLAGWNVIHMTPDEFYGWLEYRGLRLVVEDDGDYAVYHREYHWEFRPPRAFQGPR